MPATIAPWVSGLVISNIPPNMKKATITLSNPQNVPAGTGWLFYIWQQQPDLNWIPVMSAGDSALLVPTNGAVTFNVPLGPIGIQVCGFTLPTNGTGPGALSAYLSTVGPVTNGTATLTGYNFPVAPGEGSGITQLNPTTSITINAVLSGGGGM